ncbi:MAG TPA: histidine phosphatase family protein [Kofleriaceae bacterium]
MTATIYLVRHGDTKWSPERRLAGRTDLPLTDDGEANAMKLAPRLAPLAFDRVYTTPLQRARRTAELAGFADRAVIEPRLIEMSFGDYEGRTVQEIRVERPGYAYLVDGCPHGETAADLGARVDSWLAEQRTGTVLVFAHSVIMRVLTARFLGFPPEAGRHFFFSPVAIGILGFDPVDAAPAVQVWNDRAHLL